MSTAALPKPVAANPAPVTAQEKTKASTPVKEVPRSIVEGHANGHTNGHANGVHRVNSGSEIRSPKSHHHGPGCTCHLCKDVDLVHHHGAGCGCHRCIRVLNEVFPISEPYCPNPYLPNVTKDYETKVRIIQKIPEMRKVEKTFFVKQLVHEDRITTVNKSRIIMVDVEDWVHVPVIKEVPRLKKIKVHKIREEILTHTYEVPVIEYERRCTIKRIPRVELVDLEEEIEVPVLIEVPIVVRVQVPTGEFCEKSIEEYCTPGDFNLLCKDGRHHGDHHKHVDGGEFSDEKGAPGVEYGERDGPSPINGKPGDEYGPHKPLIPIKTKPGYEEPHHEPQPKPHGEPIGYTPKELEPHDKPHEHVPKPHEPVPKPHEPVPKPHEGTTYPKGIEEPKPKPYEEPKPKPVEEPRPKPYEEPKPKPHEVPKPKPYEEPKPKPYEEPKPKPVEVPKPKPVEEPKSKLHEEPKLTKRANSSKAQEEDSSRKSVDSPTKGELEGSRRKTSLLQRIISPNHAPGPNV